jgi:hypothetical protein
MCTAQAAERGLKLVAFEAQWQHVQVPPVPARQLDSQSETLSSQHTPSPFISYSKLALRISCCGGRGPSMFVMRPVLCRQSQTQEDPPVQECPTPALPAPPMVCRLHTVKYVAPPLPPQWQHVSRHRCHQSAPPVLLLHTLSCGCQS